MNRYIVNDIIEYSQDHTILLLCNNWTNCKYINIVLNRIYDPPYEPFFHLAIDQFRNYKILHIKKRLPLTKMLDQNHFHYDGFYGACIGGHLDLVDWIYHETSPALGIGLRGAQTFGQTHVTLYLERRIKEHNESRNNNDGENEEDEKRRIVKSLLGLYD